MENTKTFKLDAATNEQLQTVARWAGLDEIPGMLDVIEDPQLSDSNRKLLIHNLQHKAGVTALRIMNGDWIVGVR